MKWHLQDIVLGDIEQTVKLYPGLIFAMHFRPLIIAMNYIAHPLTEQINVTNMQGCSDKNDSDGNRARIYLPP
jgi:hypothetical protein